MRVIDASVAVKWFLEEAGSSDAKNLLIELIGEIVVPDIFVVEVVGVLVRQSNIAKSARGLIEAHIERLMHLFERESLRAERLEIAKMAHVAKLATRLGHPLKDCIYLALAMDLGCPLITADAKFAAKALEVYPEVRLLGGSD